VAIGLAVSSPPLSRSSDARPPGASLSVTLTTSVGNGLNRSGMERNETRTETGPVFALSGEHPVSQKSGINVGHRSRRFTAIQ
jgi:hypothetical protein